jgi:transposase InsO family protein
MAFWNKSKKQKEESTAPVVVRRGKGNSGNRFPVEVKVLAVRAKESGLDRKEVAELIGASLNTVDKWHQMYQEGGPEALVNQSTSPSTRRICKELERRIEARRRENPEAGVRRIRDELRREEGVAVSAETVRRVLNDAGLSNTPPVPKRKPPQERRFEREVPNAMWQIDIFTFELKRMYRVYLVGIIDDHSRYIVGHGLFRQQTADTVLEVVKGAIGQWGAPRDILSDNGRQFVAWRGKTKFQKVLRRQGVQHVRSAPHHPMTLGKIERFWRTIWEEFLSDAVFASFADASQRLSHWVAYYNHQRPHQGIGGACPAELYLLGKLGETDVRVTRKGDDIEVKVGDVIHEMIRMGAPYELDENGLGKRGGLIDEMEGHDGAGAVPGGGDGPEGGSPDQGDLPDVCSEPAGVEPGDGEGIGSGDAVAGAEEARQEGQECRGTGDHGFDEEDNWFGEDREALEDEV